MSSTTSFKKGDVVTVDPSFPGVPRGVLGRKFRVRKINPKNVACDALDGGRGINFPPESLVKTTEDAPPLVARPFVPREFFVAGDIVTFKRPPAKYSASTPFVVLKDNGEKVNVALLGGDSDRYFRVPGAGLVKRDRAWLADALLEEATAA